MVELVVDLRSLGRQIPESVILRYLWSSFCTENKKVEREDFSLPPFYSKATDLPHRDFL